MRHLSSATPVVLGGALVLPSGLITRMSGAHDSGGSPPAPQVDPAVKQRTERLAMEAVRRVEETRGCKVVDVSKEKCGWDLTSYPPRVDGRVPEARHIEVKGRLKGADTLTVTRNEILYALNQAEKFVLAIVLVDEHEDAVDGPYYLRHPFDTEPGWGVSSWNLEVKALIQRAERVG